MRIMFTRILAEANNKIGSVEIMCEARRVDFSQYEQGLSDSNCIQ